MTCEETVLRLVRLMFVSHQERWVNISLRNMTGDWLRRVGGRFAGVNGLGMNLRCSRVSRSSAFRAGFLREVSPCHKSVDLFVPGGLLWKYLESDLS